MTPKWTIGHPKWKKYLLRRKRQWMVLSEMSPSVHRKIHVANSCVLHSAILWTAGHFFSQCWALKIPFMYSKCIWHVTYDRFLRHFLINSALLYHFLANLLAHNQKMTEKSVFRKASSPEMRSQSFPVSCFWSSCFVPHWKWNLTLLAHQNTGKENRYRNICFAILISTLWRFYRANKNNCHMHFKPNATLTRKVSDYL